MNMEELSVRELSERMAEPSSFPAGGSASALSAAFAAALCTLCAGLAVKHGKAEALDIVNEAQALRRELLEDAQRDAEAFDAYLQARRAQAAQEAVEAALERATGVPVGIARRALRVLQLLDQLRPLCPEAVIADAQSARLLAAAAARACLVTARVNLKRMQRMDAAQALLEDIRALELELGAAGGSQL